MEQTQTPKLETVKIRTPFARIMVSGTSEKPYYDILYFNPGDKKFHVGYGSFCLKYVFDWLSDVFEIIDQDPAMNTVTMPCRIGDKVYRIAEGNYHSNYKPFIQELTVTEISWKKEKHGTKDLGFAIIADGIRYRFSSIGKSVFLTREEAETKLNGGIHHA